MIDLKVVGVLILSKDISIDLATSTIRSIDVKGLFNAPSELKKALKDRIK